MDKIRIDGFIFDMDGTVYLGEGVIPGAMETLRALRQQGKGLLFISNNPTHTRQEYADKLTRLGLPTEPENVLTSTNVLASHLVKTAPNLNYYVIGEEGLRRELRGYGLRVSDELWDDDPMAVIEPCGIDAVIVAFDRTFDYRKLNTAYQALLRGAHFFATNADKACPMPGGAIPDAGATIAALEHITGRKLELLAGKPSALMMQTAMEILGVCAEKCLVTGDRLETDILMGQRAGMNTCLVLTGATRREEALVAEHPPTFIVENLGQLLKIVD